jgi:hypothetical protein
MDEVAYLSDIKVGLHDIKRIRRIGTGGIRIIEKVFDLGESCLTEVGTPKLGGDGLSLLLIAIRFEPEWLRGVGEGRHDAGVQ